MQLEIRKKVLIDKDTTENLESTKKQVAYTRLLPIQEKIKVTRKL